jgi:multiple sugar transport system ATP-binding protein
MSGGTAAIAEMGARDLEVELDAVSKHFEDESGRRARGAGGEELAPALAGISFAVEKGELLVVVGPSGCGKSTTLRIVAGLEDADGGDVRIGGRSMRGVAPQDRDVAMVFQGYALYPQMTVRENIEFPLRMRKTPGPERRKRADEAAALLHLGPLMDRLPAELSGGERQRVAMGRAIVRRPRVFLFDEPLSNLDAALRQELRVEIGALVRALGVTAVYVTHDQVEAMTLGDRICVMDKGKVLQIAAPREIYELPATSFVGTFLGAPRMNLMPARLDGDALALGPFRLPASAELRARAALAKELVVGVRPEGLAVRPDGEAELVVALSEPLGAETHLLLRGLGGEDVELRARVPGFDPRRAGERVRVSVDPSRLHLFDAAEGGARIA